MMQQFDAVLRLVASGIWRASWQGSALVLLVLMIGALFRKRLGARGRYALWAIVLVRLLMPVLPESPFSIYSLMERSAPPLTASRTPNLIALGKPHAAKVSFNSEFHSIAVAPLQKQQMN